MSEMTEQQAMDLLGKHINWIGIDTQKAVVGAILEAHRQGAQSAVPQWIKCSERMPPNGEEVLAWEKDCGLVVAAKAPGLPNWYVWNWEGSVGPEITHWQPNPSSPTPAPAPELPPQSTWAEQYLREKYGAHRAHHEWRALTEAFNAGLAAKRAPMTRYKAIDLATKHMKAEDLFRGVISEWIISAILEASSGLTIAQERERVLRAALQQCLEEGIFASAGISTAYTNGLAALESTK